MVNQTFDDPPLRSASRPPFKTHTQVAPSSAHVLGLGDAAAAVRRRVGREHVRLAAAAFLEVGRW